MKFTYNNLFLKILSILNYSDKENFVKRFEEMNHLEAMMNCIEKLPEDARKEIIDNVNDKRVIEKYISKGVYMNEISIVSTKALSDFLQHLTPTITNDEKEKIAAVFPN